MKKLIVMLILILFSIPVFAEDFLDENAVNASIYHLKKLMRETHFKDKIRFLEFDNDKIGEILLMKNKDADKLIIFTIGIGLLCTIMFMVQGVVQYSYYDRDNESNNRMYAIETMVSNGLSFLSLAIQGGIWLYYFLTGPKGTLKIDETLEHLDVSADTTH